MSSITTSNESLQSRLISTGLHYLELQIVHSRGVAKYDPNGIIVAAVTESLDLGDPVGLSVLSGEPAYLYRTHEVELLLTKGELYRLLRHCLHPTEYFKLRRTVGEFFDIIPDFYCEATGLAMQPA